MAPLHFEVVQTVDPESRDAIARGLREFNALTSEIFSGPPGTSTFAMLMAGSLPA
ncbi:MAG: hypothetical protein ABSB67_05015 [Bryobacteraceae bacterium]